MRGILFELIKYFFQIKGISQFFFRKQQVPCFDVTGHLFLEIFPAFPFQKALWGMFIHNVISFRRGLMNPITLNLFKSYLGLEVNKEIESKLSLCLMLSCICYEEFMVISYFMAHFFCVLHIWQP